MADEKTPTPPPKPTAQPGSPPPSVTFRPPAVDEPARDLGRRLRIWLVLLTVIALAAAAGAGYAISEIESTKDENREDDQAVSALRADVERLREQVTERLDGVERRVDDAADAQAVQKLEDDLDAVQKRVARLDREDDGGESDEITTRVDELEQRIEDLEDEK